MGERLGAEPEESDVVHDLLAYLAERMIDMNKEKNAEIKAFLGFLEGEIGAAVDDMTNKTAVREYYNHEFQKLIDILVKNKKKLRDGYDPKSPTNYRHLQEWYEDMVEYYDENGDLPKALETAEEGILKGEGRLTELFEFLSEHFAKKEDTANLERIVHTALSRQSEEKNMLDRLFEH